MAVAGRRIEGRRFEHALAQARRQISAQQERRRARNLGYTAMTATRAAGARRASRTVAFIWRDLARLAAGLRVIVMTARDATAPGGMPLGNMAVRVLARMLAAENHRTNSVARMRVACLGTTVVVAMSPSRNRRLRALHRHRQEGDQAVGRRQTSPVVGSIKSQCSPSSQEQARTAATRPRTVFDLWDYKGYRPIGRRAGQLFERLGKLLRIGRPRYARVIPFIGQFHCRRQILWISQAGALRFSRLYPRRTL